MDHDRLTEETPPAPTPAPVPAPEHPGALARTQGVPWLLFVAMLAIAGWLAWRAFWPGVPGDPLGTSLVAFEKQNRLTVFSAQLAPVVSAEDSRLMGLVQSRQVAVIPARVDYTLDLSRMDRNHLTWDQNTRTLDVLLPPLTVGKPNLDEARAQYLREGIWITREAQDSLSRANTRTAEREALQQASNPVLIGLARAAAKDAIRQNLAIPLEVAGFGDVTVNARFEGEAPSPAPAPRPPATAAPAQP
ncbi:DUF4230 domain-containing protein [Novosphingobium album (ex Liu et al. 2023)]|uniref:DUF4230 domain-containing protein n=1 Tax=Novosphingobium album (ex Liu et al. 2023) TaxID=3031130 RepID=A0ABT5WLJ1_9SPHN|nr:DUF4230 domain-containing protein [Novosphingobium album (ex Liu et al. 2023)]MDE8650913.1 DUF4230 domain-containing protein [Novosphingobium album (ex Liu et al. 2023)]